MTLRIRPLAGLTGIAALAAALAACGGAGSTGDDPGDSSGTPTAPAETRIVHGTAATGAALPRADVRVTDRAGTPVCREPEIVTDAAGAYTCTLQDGKTAPFLVAVTDPEGAVEPMVSVGLQTPTPATPAVVNATPLTTAIVAQLSPDRSALTVLSNPDQLDTTALQAITTHVLSQLADVRAAVMAPADYDPFTTPITAATGVASGNAADKLLEVIKITVVAGQTLVATVDRPAQATLLANSTPAPAPLPAPAAGVVDLSQELRLLSNALQRCFALDLARRVVAVDVNIATTQGGPAVTETAEECDDIVTDRYLHSGYSAGQHFHGLLTDGNMTGATFTPEVMRFIPAGGAAQQDRAVVNLRYVDRNGVAGNLITVAYKFPGSRTPDHPTEWWLHGNQHPIDSSVQAVIRRREQLAPNPGTGTFANAPASRYESGVNIFINKDGPGSAGMRAVRVTGPGLPTAGLVYTRPDPLLVLSQNWMNIKSKNGVTDPAVATFSGNVGNIFLLQRTQGIAGASAKTVRPNPNQSLADPTQFVGWAHPLDYGAAPGSADYIDFAQLKAHGVYRFEVFYTGETAPRHAYDSTMLTPVTPATHGSALPWVDFTPTTKALLDPSSPRAASSTIMALEWHANPYAETIRSAGVYTHDAAGPVNQGVVPVARGATSATALAPVFNGSPVPFPTLTADGSSGRQLQLRYRKLDGGYKDSMAQFN